jgi:hypothetical protein
MNLFLLVVPGVLAIIGLIIGISGQVARLGCKSWISLPIILLALPFDYARLFVLSSPDARTIYHLAEDCPQSTFPGEQSQNSHKVEVYSRDRYIRLTGLPVTDIPPAPLGERQGELDAFLAAMAPATGPARSNGHARPEPGWQPTQISPVMSDDEILSQARRDPRNGARFVSLYDRGEWDEPANVPDRGAHLHRTHTRAGQPRDESTSVIDWWLAQERAYWTQDPAQIDRLMRGAAVARPKYDEVHFTNHPLYPPGTRVPYLEGTILLRLYHKTRHYGDRGPAPEPAPLDPTTVQERPERREQVYQDLCHNRHLSNATRVVLLDLLRKAHLDLGAPLPASAHIGFIPAELRTEGVSASSFKTAVSVLKRHGIVSAVRRTPLKQSGHPWDDLSLHGAPLNGHWRTVGQEQPPASGAPGAGTPAGPGSRAALEQENRELRAALAERDRLIAQLRTELLHYRTCDYWGSVLTATERACNDCHDRLYR